ncbi:MULTISPECIES: CBS domain-containing protein [unclassified Rhizobium]|uniref:CBS domain-containing protein n=1 Tax=unclassified Rhizobium TaxID=2613769 RepID=UPI001FEF7D4D
MQTKDIMTKKIISIDRDANIRHAIQLMLENGISGLPVVDQLQGVCGVVTEGDLLMRCEISSLSQSCADVTRADGALLTYIKSKAWRVGDVMTPNIIAVTPDTPISTVAELMATHRIKRVLVLDEGALVGLVSRREVLRAIASIPADKIAPGDEAIRLAVRTRLRTELGLAGDRICVSVRDAQVRLTGNVVSDLQRHAIRVLVERITGTRGYVDELQLAPQIA